MFHSHLMFVRLFRRVILIAAILATAGMSRNLAAQSRAAGKADLSQFYGFKELEIFKLEQRSSGLVAGDLNNDGLTDLLLIDNSHSRLDLLQQRAKQPAAKKSAGTSQSVNDLSNHWRFEHVKIPVDRQVATLALGDFNGDKLTDIAYLATPDRLVIRRQTKTGSWADSSSIRLADIDAQAGLLAAGDINGDKRDDLVVLGKRRTYVIPQQNGGKLGTPQQVMNTSGKLAHAKIADLDGDGRNDLSYTAQTSDGRVFCARFQTAAGKLGPELRFDLDKPRAFTLLDADGKPGMELATVASRTGRVNVLRLKKPKARSDEIATRLVQYGFGSGSSSDDRDLATGDLDGDGLIDIVVTAPDTAQMIVYRQTKADGLVQAGTFPGFVGAEQVRIARFAKDGPNEVVVLSKSEKTIGLSRLKDGRLTFPSPLPIVGEPYALDTADLNRDGVEEIVYVSKTTGKGESQYALRALQQKGGKWTAYKFAGLDWVPIKSSGTPKVLKALDANGDGKVDFLTFPGLGRPPALFVTDKDGVPMPHETKAGIRLGNVDAPAVTTGRLGKPVLLVAQKNFARNMRLQENGQWSVVDQYNAAESDAAVAAAATLDLDGKPGNEVVLIDTGVKKLRVLRKEGSVYRQWKEVDMGSFPFRSLRVADLNGDKRDDLLLVGEGKFGVLYAGRVDPKYVEIASHQSKLDKAFFSDLIAGDLNSDGHVDIVTFDTATHFVEILDFGERTGLRHGIRFPLFEQKSFTRRTTGGSEPRESLIVDVTNDGRPDLVLLIHDRVIVYPQDGGE